MCLCIYMKYVGTLQNCGFGEFSHTVAELVNQAEWDFCYEYPPIV
jgi:hypothetical protein